MMAGAAVKLRQTFKFVNKDAFRLFPQHMHKAMVELSSKLRLADAIIEVHDARIPFTGRNRKFDEQLAIRPRIVVFNKVDVADLNEKQYEVIRRRIQDSQGGGVAGVVFAACADDKDKQLRQLIPKLGELALNAPRYHRLLKEEINVLVVGIPNVGKSTLINYLRCRNTDKKGRATQVGAVPGVTRSVSGRIMISQRPPIYVFDSPGILQPTIGNPEIGMKLALCGTMADHQVGEESIVDYMLFVLNKQKNFKYVEVLGLPNGTPIDNVWQLLRVVAKQENFQHETRNMSSGALEKTLDINRTARHLIGLFRQGKFGKIMLDADQFDNIVDETK